MTWLRPRLEVGGVTEVEPWLVVGVCVWVDWVVCVACGACVAWLVELLDELADEPFVVDDDVPVVTWLSSVAVALPEKVSAASPAKPTVASAPATAVPVV